MATTSSTWSCERGLVLRGLGVDIEKVGRFIDIDPLGRPLPFVFTAHELAAAARSRHAATHLCTVFAVKEALRKALGEPYDYAACEVEVTTHVTTVRLSPGSLGRGVTSATVVVTPHQTSGDIVAEVYLFEREESAA